MQTEAGQTDPDLQRVKWADESERIDVDHDKNRREKFTATCVVLICAVRSQT